MEDVRVVCTSNVLGNKKSKERIDSIYYNLLSAFFSSIQSNPLTRGWGPVGARPSGDEMPASAQLQIVSSEGG